MFVDESGDLGFGPRSSRHITVAAIVTGESPPLERIPLRIRRRRLKKSLLQKPELKFHNSDPVLRRTVLMSIATLNDARIIGITIDKARARPEDMADREGVYMHASGELVRGVAKIAGIRYRLTLVFDTRPCNREFGAGFDNEIRERSIGGYLDIGRIPPDVCVRRLDSLNSRGLQMADYVAGAIQRVL